MGDKNFLVELTNEREHDVKVNIEAIGMNLSFKATKDAQQIQEDKVVEAFLPKGKSLTVASLKQKDLSNQRFIYSITLQVCKSGVEVTLLFLFY